MKKIKMIFSVMFLINCCGASFAATENNGSLKRDVYSNSFKQFFESSGLDAADIGKGFFDVLKSFMELSLSAHSPLLPIFKKHPEKYMPFGFTEAVKVKSFITTEIPRLGNNSIGMNVSGASAVIESKREPIKVVTVTPSRSCTTFRRVLVQEVHKQTVRDNKAYRHQLKSEGKKKELKQQESYKRIWEKSGYPVITKIKALDGGFYLSNPKGKLPFKAAIWGRKNLDGKQYRKFSRGIAKNIDDKKNSPFVPIYDWESETAETKERSAGIAPHIKITAGKKSLLIRHKGDGLFEVKIKPLKKGKMYKYYSECPMEKFMSIVGISADNINLAQVKKIVVSVNLKSLNKSSENPKDILGKLEYNFYEKGSGNPIVTGEIFFQAKKYPMFSDEK